jgi:hypothetical protein
MPDGARSALLGYLYQLVQVATLRACAANAAEAEPEWPVLLALIARARLTSELFNQDAVALADDGSSACAAIQVKYSEGGNESIDFQSFVELLHGFEQARLLAQRDQWTVESYFLITNRSLNSSVEEILADPSETSIRRALKKRVSNPPEWLAKLFRRYANADSALQAWAAALAKLEPPLNASFQRGLDKLCQFAHWHGVLPEELDSALTNLIGRLFQDSASAKPLEITASWLRLHLTGVQDAVDIRFTADAGIMAQSRERLTARLQQ